MAFLAANFDPHRDYDWLILHTTGGIGNFDPAAISLDTSGFKNDLSGGRFGVESASGNLIIHFSAVPEPISMAVYCFAGIFAAHRRCFRR
jgi:hypothetical protein